MRVCNALLAWMLAMSAPALAQDYGPQPDTATREEILRLRDSAWRTWFSGDATGFQQVVPDELVAMGWNGGAWDDRAQTLRRMSEYQNSKQRIRTLEFPHNVFQQYGDVVILYTRFRLVLVDAEGATSETRGRGTEVFVRRKGRWIHTGWHLDAIADAP